MTKFFQGPGRSSVYLEYIMVIETQWDPGRYVPVQVMKGGDPNIGNRNLTLL